MGVGRQDKTSQDLDKTRQDTLDAPWSEIVLTEIILTPSHTLGLGLGLRLGLRLRLGLGLGLGSGLGLGF